MPDSISHLPTWNSTRRRLLIAGAGGATSLLFGGDGNSQGRTGPRREFDPIAQLVKLEVKLANWVRGAAKRILDAPLNENRANNVWVDYGFRWPAFTLAHLFTSKHVNNTLFGQPWCAKLAMQLIDKEVSHWHHARDRGGRISTGETPHYVAAYVLQQLGDRVRGQRREDWLQHAQAWVDQALVRPLGITGGYHDSWRMTALYRLGELLDQPRWTETGVFLFKRLLSRQTKEGFWEDDRHHGPSARYCGLMLPSLAWMYRWTGDEAFGDAARRLADFMATYVFPDGTTVGAFDGRNCNQLAYFPICPGMELTAKGRAYAARAFGLWNDCGMFDDISTSAPSTRDLPRLAFYAADTCVYLSQFAPRPNAVIAPQSKLPIDKDGALENHTAEFDGLLLRHGPWVAAVSSQNSHARGVYRLERQSRLEIWHERARLLIGGGHNHQDWPIPHANVVLDTGNDGESQFGAAAGESRRISGHYYRPQAAQSKTVDGVPCLQLEFGHGRVRYRILFPADNRAEIHADWNVHRVRRLCLQLPLVIWRGAEVLIDGQRQDADGYRLRTIEKLIQVRGGLFQSDFALELPEGVPARVHFPLWTGTFHGGAEKHRQEDAIQNWFDLALVSCQWTEPAAEGRARFVLHIQ